jgi:hypothetical protein
MKHRNKSRRKLRADFHEQKQSDPCIPRFYEASDKICHAEAFSLAGVPAGNNSFPCKLFWGSGRCQFVGTQMDAEGPFGRGDGFADENTVYYEIYPGIDGEERSHDRRISVPSYNGQSDFVPNNAHNRVCASFWELSVSSLSGR